MRHRMMFVSPGLALGLLTLVATQCEAAEAARVTASALNVRSGPSTRNRILGVTRRGEQWPVLGRSGSWVKVRFRSADGWVHGRYVQTVTVSTPRPPATSNGTTYQVNASQLNVRSGPSTRNRIVGRLNRGARVQGFEAQGAWRRIAFNGGRAWVHGSYLVRPGAAPPRPPARPTSRVGFIQLRASGSGFVAYSSSPTKRWGKPALIYGIERVAAAWAPTRRPRIAVGNISKENGGFFPPHLSHRNGVDADFRPMRTDGEGAVTIYSSRYSRSRTQDLMNRFRRAVSVRSIFFNDRRTSGTSYIPGHHNHFHLRING